MRLVRLTPEKEILPFDCGDHDLNGFLFDDAKNYLKDLLAVTYIIEDDEKTLAFFCYQNDKVSHNDVGGDFEKFIQRIGVHVPLEKRKKHKSYPAVKIGRLAVHKDLHGTNAKLGTQIIRFTKKFFTEGNKTGCKFITVDAYKKSLGFYEKMGFKYLTSRDKKSSTRLMYYNLDSIT